MIRKIAGRLAGRRLGAAAATLLAAPPAWASFLPPELMDKAADVITWVVIIFVPLGVIAAFWLIHILPEKIAEKRHHPQKEAIKTLCLLSLVFGGMLWPFAWLWAYSRPVVFKAAYGTEKHEDYYVEKGHQARAGELMQEEIEHLRHELDELASKGSLPAELKRLREDLAVLEPSGAAAGPAEEKR